MEGVPEVSIETDGKINLTWLFLCVFVCYNSNKRTKTSRVTIKNP